MSINIHPPHQPGLPSNEPAQGLKNSRFCARIQTHLTWENVANFRVRHNDLKQGADPGIEIEEAPRARRSPALLKNHMDRSGIYRHLLSSSFDRVARSSS